MFIRGSSIRTDASHTRVGAFYFACSTTVFRVSDHQPLRSPHREPNERNTRCGSTERYRCCCSPAPSPSHLGGVACATPSTSTGITVHLLHHPNTSTITGAGITTGTGPHAVAACADKIKLRRETPQLHCCGSKYPCSSSIHTPPERTPPCLAPSHSPSQPPLSSCRSR
jgi:hypothetical protein